MKGTYSRTNCCRLRYIAQRERIFASALETDHAPNHLSCIQRGQQRVGVYFVTSISTTSGTKEVLTSPNAEEESNVNEIFPRD